MRGFPFGALSSSESLKFRWMMWPCAEREAPYANSLSADGDCFMGASNPARRDEEAGGTTPNPGKEFVCGASLSAR